MRFEVMKDAINEHIERANTIALFTHINCDCDAIGSICAFYQYLHERNKNVSMFCDSDIPEKYSFLDNVEKINQNKLSENYDLAISLDTSTTDRLGKFKEIFLKTSNNINIDHHVTNTEFAKINYVQPESSSCAEILYEIFKSFSQPISDSVATSLFAGISSDTNHFMNKNVQPKTFAYAGELLDLKADFNKVVTHLQKNKTPEQLKLAGYMASNLKYKNGVSYVVITSKILKKFNAKSSDVSNFLMLICDAGGSKITISMKQKDKNEFQFNLRSVENYDVNRVANVFGGGGHKNAAGCTVREKCKKALNKVLQECIKEVERKGV